MYNLKRRDPGNEVGSGIVYNHHDFTHNIDKMAVEQDEMLKLCENHVKK